MSDLESILGSIAVLPFPPKRFFLSSEKASTKAFVQCPKCYNIGNFYDLEKIAPFISVYCQGSLPPEIEHQNLIGGGSHTHQVSCAGVMEPHFHTKCQVCEFSFFIGLPEDNNG